MKQTANKASKKPDLSWAHLSAHHAAVKPTLDHELPSTVGDRPIAEGRDLSQVPLNSTEYPSLHTDLTQPCSFTPQRCPFGGACHTCPPRVQATKTIGIQRKAKNNDELTEAPPIVHEVLRSPGRPLDSATRAIMEPRFGYAFNHVRVHTDGKAAQSAWAVNALAYTVGRDVVFGEGRFAPATRTGHRLLAHELAHVVQQGAGPATARLTPGPLVVSNPSNNYEYAAAQVADSVMAREQILADGLKGLMSEVPRRPGIFIQRQVDDGGDQGRSSEPLAGEEVRARCGPTGMGCQLVISCGSTHCAVTDCGRGTCPTCPPGLGNLIVRHWCTYSCLDGTNAIVLHLAFGGRMVLCAV
jgi:hypothetical protein